MKKLFAILALLFATSAAAYTTTGFFVRSYYTMMGGSTVQVCVYNVNGDEMSYVFPVTKVCPWKVEIEL